MARFLSAATGVVLVLTGAMAASGAARSGTAEATINAVRTEALRSNDGPDGRPLPLVAHWHRRSMPLSWQIQQIEAGHHMLPWIDFGHGAQQADAAAQGLKQLAAWHMPFTIITGGQWEAEFYRSPEYKKLPADQTGVGVSLKGNKINAVSPFSPIEPWRKLGRAWTQRPFIRELEKLYPNPPRVFLVSNNEAHDMRWHKAEKLKRYVEKYGTDKDDDFKRKVFGDGWIERYSALIDGMRDGLTNPNWKKNSRFIAYNAFGPDHFGRWSAWEQYSLHTEDRITWDWYAWQGGVPESYDNHWEPGKKAYNVWSMQTEMMNLVFMKKEAYKVNPDFWFEVIFWDGYLPKKKNNKRAQYVKDGIIEETPAFYRGWTQYVIWTLTPRVARGWRGSAFNKENWIDYFDQLEASVDLVYSDPVLARFWRKGTLVANHSHKHPFQTNIPAKWKDVDRWFGLDTNLDPKSWGYSEHVPVYALARVIGEKPGREWLVYAHAPMGDKKQVEITIPDYGKIAVDVPVAGAFYHVKESDHAVTRVGK